MSLSPISQYASTASARPWVANIARASQASKAPVQSLASGEIVQADGHSQELNAAAKTPVNVTYDRLSRQSDIGPGGNVNPSLKSFLASYSENSAGGASAQSAGTLFRALA
jgi:hypothetical protein